MKKIIFALLVSVAVVSSALAEDLSIISEKKQNLLNSSEQLPYQQLIGYAIEASSVALSEKVDVGSYACEQIYSTEGYNELSKYPCDLIVHSKQGPIVVKYQDVSDAMDKEIKDFLAENRIGPSLYYNKGRFRFEVDEESSN